MMNNYVHLVLQILHSPRFANKSHGVRETCTALIGHWQPIGRMGLVPANQQALFGHGMVSDMNLRDSQLLGPPIQ